MKKSISFLAWWFFLYLPAQAAVTGWDGGGDNGYWTNAINWSNNIVPAVGAGLIFPASKPFPVNTNTIGAVSNFDSFTFNGSNYVFYAPEFQLTNAISNYASGPNTINAALTLNGTVKIFATNNNASLTLNSNIALNGHQLFPSNAAGTVTINGAIAGLGTMSKAGAGTLYLNGSNSFSSALLFNAGILGGTGYIPGITASGGMIFPGASSSGLGTLNCHGDLILSNAAYFAGALIGGAHGLMVVTNHVILTNATLSLSWQSNGFFPTNAYTILSKTSTGAISGIFAGLPEGKIFTNGVDLLSISYLGGDGNDIVIQKVGVVPFTWDGGGTNYFWNSASNWAGDKVPAAFGQLVFPANAARLGNSNSDVTLEQFDSVIFTGSNYVLNLPSASLQLYRGITNSITAKTNSIIGDVILANNAVFQTTSSGGTLLLNGSLNPSNHVLTVTGAGTTVINSVLTNKGTIVNVGSGSIHFNGGSIGQVNITASNGVCYADSDLTDGGAARVDVYSGATLTGNGTLAKAFVHSGGTLDPGDIGTAGQLSIFGGSLALEAGAICTFDLFDPGSSDQIEMGASSFINAGATLNLNLNLGVAPGQSFTLVLFQESGTTPAPFAGLSEGSIFNLGGDLFQITYLGGSSGRDIVITDLGGSPTGNIRQWTNGTGLLTWTNTSNWVSSTTPQPGDDLYFPSNINASRKSTTNGAAGTFNLNRLVVGSDGFSITGGQSSSSLLLTGGIVNTNPGSTLALNLPVYLNAAQTFSNASAASLTFGSGSALNLGTNLLALRGGGIINLPTAGLTGNGSMVISGPSVNLSGINFLGGGLVISNGVCIDSGVISSGPPIRVENAAQITLGIATIPGLTMHGGTLVLDQSGHNNNVVGNLTFSTNTAYDTTLNPVTYLSVVGSITLSNAVLSFDNFTNVVAGQIITNIVNNGADPVVGTFAGLPEGSAVYTNGLHVRISYVGGDGNDITFTILPPSLTNTAVLSNKQFQFNGANGIAGTTLVIQASTNLVNWLDISTNVVSSGFFSFIDTNASSFKYRFYRTRFK